LGLYAGGQWKIVVFASHAFSVAAPTVWNSLTENVVNSGHLGNFQKATENSPFSLHRVKRSCHRTPLQILSWHYTSFIIVLYCINLLIINYSVAYFCNDDLSA